jgi:hypothetical protein
MTKQDGTSRKGSVILLVVASLLILSGVFMSGAARGQSDSTPPVVIDIDLIPLVIDSRIDAQTITVTARFTDDLSGVLAADIIFMPVDGDDQYVSVGFDGDGSTDFNATKTLQVPRFSALGQWRIYRVRMFDMVGNTVQLYSLYDSGPWSLPRHLAGLGFWNGPKPTPTILPPAPTATPIPLGKGFLPVVLGP